MVDTSTSLALATAVLGGALILPTEAPVVDLMQASAQEPRVHVAPQPATADRQSAIVASRAGDYYYADIRINGAPMRVIVDTGSNTTVLRADDARRASLQLGASLVLATAGDPVPARRAQIDELRIAGRTLTGIAAVVPEGELQTSLIGTKVLEALGPMVVSGAEITLYEN